jgi:uncharacterized protein involved in exopolysaccharide biosynthesis
MVDQGGNIGLDREAAEDGESGGLDFEQVREIAGFVLRAVRRHPKLAVLTFAVVAALGVTVSLTMPRTYNSRVKLLGQRGTAMRILTSPIPGMEQVDNPTRNVTSMIMRRDNLVALAKDAKLAERFDETRSAPLRLKDYVMAKLNGPPSEDDKLQAMVFTLENRLDVLTDEPTSTVIISVDWANPRVAYDLVTLVQKNFLEARYDSDVAVVNDSIAVLEDHGKSELARVDAELEEYQRLVAEKVAAEKAMKANTAIAAAPPTRVYVGVPRAPTSSSAAAAAQPTPDPDLAKSLEQTRLRIKSLEEAQQRTSDGLKAQLLQAQLTLTPMHPTVIALQQQLEAISQPSPELAQLRAEERSLMSQIAPLRAAPVASAPPPAQMLLPIRTAAGGEAVDAGPAQPPLPLLPAPSLDRDGQLQLAESKLGSAIRAYEDTMGRIDAVKVELDITRAAYKHKYTVVTPAEIPAKPKKSTAQQIGIGAVVGGLALAVLLAAAVDFLKGSILESWQVRRRLKIEVLGELDGPS